MSKLLKLLLFALLITLSGCEKSIDNTNDDNDDDPNDSRYDRVYLFELQNEHVFPFEMVHLHTQDKLPDYETYKATLNDTDVTLHQVSDSVLVFLVPQNIASGNTTLNSPLFNEPIRLNVEKSPEIGHPDDYLNNAIDKLLTDLESLMGDTSEVFMAHLNQHYENIKDASEKLKTLSSEDRAAAAQFLAANNRITSQMKAIMDSIDLNNLKSSSGSDLNGWLRVAIGTLGGAVALTSTSVGTAAMGAFVFIEILTYFKTGEKFFLIKKAINMAGAIFSKVGFPSIDFHTIISTHNSFDQSLEEISNRTKSQDATSYRIHRHTPIKIRVKPILTSFNEDVSHSNALAGEFYYLYSRLKVFVEKYLKEIGPLPGMVNLSEYYNIPDSLGIDVYAKINDEDRGKYWLSIDRFPQKDKSVVVFFNSDKDDAMDFELSVDFRFPEEQNNFYTYRAVAKETFNCQLLPPHKLVYAHNGAEVPDHITFTNYKTMDVRIVNSNNRTIEGFDLEKVSYVRWDHDLIAQPVTRSSTYTDAFVFDLWPILEKEGEGTIIINYHDSYPFYIQEMDTYENMTIHGNYYKKLTYDFTNTFKNHYSYTIKGATYSLPIHNLTSYFNIQDQHLKNLTVGSKIPVASSYFPAGSCGYEGQNIVITVTQVKYLREDGNPVMLAGTLSGNGYFHFMLGEEPDPCNGTIPVTGSIFYNLGESEIYIK
jgi:hypothetical protein